MNPYQPYNGYQEGAEIAHTEDPLASALTRAQFYNEAKKEAISLLHAIYGNQYPSHYSFNVLVGAQQFPDAAGPMRWQYITRAIVYTDSACRNWAIEKTGSELWASPSQSLDASVDGLRVKFNMMCESMVNLQCSSARALKNLPLVDKNGDEIEENGQ